MPRKHQAIIQSGGNKGKLKKGYRYSGKKLKNGLPQIVKVKKSKKKTMYGSGKTNETEEAKREQPRDEDKQQQPQMNQQIELQNHREIDQNFSVVTHNIGPANQRWVHYNYENKPPKIFYEEKKKYMNACFVKQNEDINRNFETYYPNQEKYDIYMLQELQEGDEDKDLVFSGINDYKGYYTTTGNVPYLVGNVEDLVLGNTEENSSQLYSEDPDSKIKRIIHGAAVIWNTNKFTFVETIPSNVGFASTDGLTKRATPWVILKTIDNNTKYAFLSIQCPIDDEIREKGVETRDALIKSVEKLPADVIPVIGGDLNQDLINQSYTPNTAEPSLDKKYKGIKKFHYIPNKCIITNYNWSFEYKKVTKRDEKYNKPIEYKEIDIIPERGLSKKYNGCVDYFLIAGRKLSQFYLNYSNVQVNRGLMAMHRIENNKKFIGEKLHKKGNKGMKFYDPTYEMKQDFDHASISMIISNPTENNDYDTTMSEYNDQLAIKEKRIAKYKNTISKIQDEINIHKQSIENLQSQFEKKEIDFEQLTSDVSKVNTEISKLKNTKWKRQQEREKEEEEEKQSNQFEDMDIEEEKYPVETNEVSEYTSNIQEHEKWKDIKWKDILERKKHQQQKQQQNLDNRIKQKQQERKQREQQEQERQQQRQQPQQQYYQQPPQYYQQQPYYQQPYYQQPQQPQPYYQQQPQQLRGNPLNNYNTPLNQQQPQPQQLRGNPLNNYNTPLNKPYKPYDGGKTKKTKKTKKVRRHKGIIQNGGNKGKLKKGYKYSGKKLKNGLPEIVKSKSKKNNVNKR